MKEDNINALDEIHKGACMGMEAIHFILDKVEDDDLKKELMKEHKNYKNILSQVEDIYPKYNNDKPHDLSAMNKVMTWYGIEIKTLLNDSTSKITELLLEGVNMGIIEGKKILNNKELDKEVKSIIDKYVKMQERSVEALKEFL